MPRTPTPSIGTSRGNDLLKQALANDKAGNNDLAIQLYEQAIGAGLDATSTRTAQVEIGLLDLLVIQDTTNDRDRAARCTRANQNLRSATVSGADGRTGQLAADALKELSALCP